MQKPFGTSTYHDKNGSHCALWFSITIVNVHIGQSALLVSKIRIVKHSQNASEINEHQSIESGLSRHLR